MNKGDLIFVKESNKEKTYVFYDKNMLVSAGFTGITIHKVSDVINENVEFRKACFDINYKQRNLIRGFLLDLITNNESTTFKERSNFLRYLCWVYKNRFNIYIIDNPIEPTPDSILQYSDIVIK